MPSKKPSMIDAMRAKHDPHYKLAAKVAGLQDSGGRVDKVEKDIAVKLESLHKTLSKSFAMQRKALMRVAGVEGRIKNLETGVEIWTNREADRNKNRDTSISNLTDIVIQALGDIRAGKAGKDGAAGVSGVDGTSGSDGTSGVDGASGLDGLDGGAGSSGDDGAAGISGESFLDPGNYEKFATELQQSGTIAGTQLSPQDRKEGFKISKGGLKNKATKINFRKFLGKVSKKVGAKGKSGKSGKSGSAGGFGSAGSTGKSGRSGASSAAADVDGVSKDPEAAEEAQIDTESKDSPIQEVKDFINNALDPSLTKIEENLEKILGNFEDQIDINKERDEKLKLDEDSSADDAREAKLESKGGKSMLGQSVDKAVKPVKSFMDTIINFFTNILLGGAVMGLLNILENPEKIMKPIREFTNGLIDFINSFMKGLWTWVVKPINFILDGINAGFKFIGDGINKALSLVGGFKVPVWNIPTIDEAPQIPRWEGGGKGGEAVAMSGGGVVPGGKGDYWANRGDTSHFGSPGYRMGQVLPDQLIYNFDKFTSTTKDVNGKIVEEKEELIELGGSIGMPDLIENQTQLVDSLRKEEGYEDVNFMDVVQYPEDKGRLVSMPQQQLYPILNASDAWKASDAKRDAAMKIDDDNNLLFLDPREVSKKVGGFNKGGQVPGKGEGDTVPAMLTPGEFVMSKGAVDQIGVGNLMAMNKSGGGTNKPKMMKFAGGGSVPDVPAPPGSGSGVIVLAPKGGTAGASAGGSANAGGVDRFSAEDVRSTSFLTIKSIYNLVG